jgi:hypothetical protein
MEPPLDPLFNSPARAKAWGLRQKNPRGAYRSHRFTETGISEMKCPFCFLLDYCWTNPRRDRKPRSR